MNTGQAKLARPNEKKKCVHLVVIDEEMVNSVCIWNLFSLLIR